MEVDTGGGLKAYKITNKMNSIRPIPIPILLLQKVYHKLIVADDSSRSYFFL